ncbi:single-stranded DNA-binding protein [Mycoplasmopsis bovis]|uniref:single-stranded DNA-binding protein n=1 Tax=Mycoplasmopsis bovis TaxID=28903 RepID=UPI0027A8B6E6
MEKLNKISLNGQVASEQYYIKDFENTKGKVSKLLKFKLLNINDKKHNYFDIVTWDKTAELVESGIKKGDYITVSGYLESNAYLKNNEKVYTLNIVADEVSLVKSKEQEEAEKNWNKLSKSEKEEYLESSSTAEDLGLIED